MILNENELFRDVNFDVMDEIAGIASEANYPGETVLFGKGEKADRLFILLKGSVNLVIQNGGSITYSLTEPGEVIGWSSLVASGAYTASGVCVTDVSLIMIPVDKLDRILQKHPEAGYRILKQLGGVFSKRLTAAYRDLLSALGSGTNTTYG